MGNIFSHLDNDYNRLNFFLVFESVLLGVVGLLYSRPNSSVLVLKLIVLLGLSLTAIWAYIQARQNYLLYDLQEQLIALSPRVQNDVGKTEASKMAHL